ncbi:hypothetical protein [Phyllobacterium endophyticum]|uniref:Uncharacterized protein n=1 Tax=Phyllobacterium endophyticum TaxID=1149773 RepID=A0A2P7AUX6_9HYPH|nr:hypothetical protein [Phyllobacterium endophyticum]MBB3234534.1 hypothetical protein [Phyllobacterium endophyticum]PSH58019.1 hypothetical protein CU100_10150 [Phyllobacterium endophyticum]TYR38687.1 hypothetical protein FY050_22110 [Phyllobacterium endophyticum]
MVGFYKFLDKAAVHYLLEGSFKFGRLKKYRLMEAITGDQWIGDKNEGVQTTVINVVIGDEPNSELADALSASGHIRIDGQATNVSVSETCIIEEFDCFAFCFSHGDLSALCSSMSDPKRGDFSYDGCVEILDPDALVQLILSHGICLGKPVSELFVVDAKHVTYEDEVEHDFRTDLKISPGNPFQKSLLYKDQCEVRIVLVPKEGPILKDDIVVSIVGALCPVASIDISGNVNAASLEKTQEVLNPNEQDCIASLKSLISDWNKVKGEIRASASPPLYPYSADPESWRAEAHRQIDFESRAITEAFEVYRKPLIDAYWGIRRLPSCDRVDDMVLVSAPWLVLTTTLQRYLAEHLGLPIGGWNDQW